MMLRKLNEAGVQKFSEFLDSLTVDPSVEIPKPLLIDQVTSENLSVAIEIEERVFLSRFEVAVHLDEKLSNSGLTDVEKDKGLWSWLSLFYFDQLCSVDSSGKRKPGERARWIPDVYNFRKYYRHLLVGPYRIYRAHRDDPERAIALLCGPINQPGDIAEQLASRQELVTNKGVMETAKKLYIDLKTLQPRRGAAGKGGGSARRFAEVLNQFDVTWDLYAMNASDLLTMLPKEFDRFRAQAT